ncbi:MAG: hypothetical protein IIC50_24395 [Planctomycetes bacterium]|nr:hypothetical protein [Planctomycetota bacterium]
MLGFFVGDEGFPLAYEERIMAKYEYKVLYTRPGGTMLFPWASQKVRDAVGRGALEITLNHLADEGWEVVSSTTSSFGSILYFFPMATVILRREKT